MAVIDLARKRRNFGLDEQRVEAILAVFRPGAGQAEFQRLAEQAEHPRIVEAAFEAAPAVPAGSEIVSEYDGVYKLATLLRREFAPERRDSVATGDDRSRTVSALRRAVGDVIRDFGYRTTEVSSVLAEPRDHELAFFVRGGDYLAARQPDELYGSGHRIGLVVTRDEVDQASCMFRDGAQHRPSDASAAARVMATFGEAMQGGLEGVRFDADGYGLAVFDARRVRAMGGMLARRDEQLNTLCEGNLIGKGAFEALKGAEHRAARAWKTALAETDRRIGASREGPAVGRAAALKLVERFLSDERAHAEILATKVAGSDLIERAAAVRAMSEKRSGAGVTLFERQKAGEPVVFATAQGERVRLLATARDLEGAQRIVAGGDSQGIGATGRALAACADAISDPKTGAVGLASVVMGQASAVAVYLDPAKVVEAARAGKALAIADSLPGAVDAARAAVVRAKQQKGLALEREGLSR